jgi:hypothetical protein
MEKQADYVKDLSQIRSLMERSSRFISLSGLSGIFAGLFALAGAGTVYYQLHNGRFQQYRDFPMRGEAKNDPAFVQFCFLVAALVLVFSFVSSIYFTTRKARQEGQKIFDRAAIRLLINTMIPLLTGGVFCLALLYHGAAGLIAPATLVFYGLALINGSKYTLDDIRYLGFCQLALGLISAFFIGYGLVFWSVGFGALHIVYGLVMYNKYERK